MIRTVFFRLFPLLLVCGGCMTSNEETLPLELPDPTNADAAAYVAFPDGLAALAASRLPADGSGLIGRNRAWGALYSPRFQLGAGAALRMTLAGDRPSEARRAFRAVEVGTEVIRQDGSIPSSLPPEIGGRLSVADIASAGAFFLGDACLGLLALEATEDSKRVVSNARREAVKSSLARAVAWLLTQRNLLIDADRSAPNRLLFDALAFQACGALAPTSVQAVTHRETAKFVDAALVLYNSGGFFVEGGGHDTSYQGVALRVGEDLLLAGYTDHDGRLGSALDGAAKWLAGRVDAEGRIDSAGNTRTCDAGETVFGKPKRIAVVDVFAGLVYSGVRSGAASVLGAAGRVEAWALTNQEADPCFPLASGLFPDTSVDTVRVVLAYLQLKALVWWNSATPGAGSVVRKRNCSCQSNHARLFMPYATGCLGCCLPAA